MNKSILVIGGIIIIALGAWWLWGGVDGEPVEEGEQDEVVETVPDEEAAEMTGFGFMQDVLAAAPGGDDAAAADRVYAALSERARSEVSEDEIMRDIALFIGIQDVPEHGVSVENLEMHSDTEATLIVGLNFSGGPAIRAIDMIIENGEWKVDAIRTLESYPPEDEVVTPPDNDEVMFPPNSGENGGDENGAIARDGCYIGGCSSQICSEDPDVISTCEWFEEYACYRNATCERQADGQCGWTETESLQQCIADARN